MEIDTNEANINRYINDELKGKDLAAFEALLQKDKTLKEKINFHKDVDSVLKEKMAPVKTYEKEEAALKPLLKEFGDVFFLAEDQTSKYSKTTFVEPQTKDKPGIVRRLFPLVGLAAAAAVLLFLFFPKQENELFAKHFEIPANHTKMSPPDNMTTFDKANKEYKAGNYTKAISLFNQSLQEDANNPKALLYKGGAELQLNNSNKALKTFQQLATQHSKYVDIANWYLALCYLNNGDDTQAKNTLKLVTPNDKEYYNKAQQLLKEI